MLGLNQRLYALLLRRVLGPYLEDESLKKLHRSIEVSLQEGCFVLREINLKCESIMNFLQQQQSHTSPLLRLRKIRIGTLKITLLLKENQEDREAHSTSSSQEGSTSFAWRAAHLGTTVSLLASIEVDDVEVYLDPNVLEEEEVLSHTSSSLITTDSHVSLNDRHTTTKISGTSSASFSSVKSTLSSYIDSILKSLRLQLRATNVRIRLFPFDEDQHCIELSLKEAKYNDVEMTRNSSAEYQTIMHKKIEIARVAAAMVGENNETTMIAQIEGPSSLQLRAIEYLQSDKDNTRIQNDIEIQLHRIQSFCDRTIVKLLMRIARDWNRVAARKQPSIPLYQQHESVTEDNSSGAISEVEADLDTIGDFVKKYRQARSEVENNEVRGGVILPDEEVDDTFDTFFDANDQSLLKFSTTLKESLILNKCKDENASFVHTKIRLQVDEASLKLSFRDNSISLGDWRTDEYLLAVVQEISFASSLAGQSSHISFEIQSFDIEESMRPGENEHLSHNDIGSILHFPRPSIGTPTVLSPACISFAMKSSVSMTNVTLTVEPFEVMYGKQSVAHLEEFLQDLLPVETSHSSPRNADEGFNDKRPNVLIEFQSIMLIIPAPVEEPADDIFNRGTSLSFTANRKDSCIGVFVENVVCQCNQNETTYDQADEHLSLSLDFIIVSALVSSSRVAAAHNKLFDIACICGDHPGSKIELVYLRNSQGPTSSYFPSVPSLSRFKARQEDEDDKDTGFPGKTVFNEEFYALDLQPEMEKNALSSSYELSVFLPEVSVDLSVSETKYFLLMINALGGPKNTKEGSSSTPSRIQSLMSLDFRVGRLSAALHGVPEQCSPHAFTYFFDVELNSFQSHILLKGQHSIQQTRILAFGIDILYGEAIINNDGDISNVTSEDRRVSLKERHLRCDKTKTLPILYKSHIFSPISKDSPQLVVDFLMMDDRSVSMHFTGYDSTLRCEFGTKWIERLEDLLSTFAISSSDTDDIGTAMQMSSSIDIHAGLYVSLYDCNIDYYSASRFTKQSRAILRWGELRLGSSVTVPLSPDQRIGLTVRDISLSLCPTKHPYHFENSKLIVPSMTLSPPDRLSLNTDIDHQRKIILSEMKLRTIMTLDRLCVTATKSSSPSKLNMEIKAGEMSAFLCKDSFLNLMDSLNDLTLEAFAVDDGTIEAKQCFNVLSSEHDSFFDAASKESSKEDSYHDLFDADSVDNPIVEEFLLDGYDWTTIDNDMQIPKGGCDDDQQARWYHSKSDTNPLSTKNEEGRLNIVSNYMSLSQRPDDLHFPDSATAKYSGLSTSPLPICTLMITDFQIKLRLFDGFDWPEFVPQPLSKATSKKNQNFIIGSVQVDQEPPKQQHPSNQQKDEILSNLLSLEEVVDSHPSPFAAIPLPEEKHEQSRISRNLSHLIRRTDRYFQLSSSGISMRVDSFADSTSHQLSSILSLKVNDFFVAETLSSPKPIKMVGEWFSETEHPRETNQGLLSLKIVSWHAHERVTQEGVLANDVCEAMMSVLPLRCKLDQKAIRFATIFFQNDSQQQTRPLPAGLHQVPPPIVRIFRAESFKVKVDYKPQSIDPKSLYNGAVVELVNLSPIDEMVLSLKEVVVRDVTGFGEVAQKLVHGWIHDVTSTQLHKFLTNTRPLEPLTHVGGAASDLIVLPWEAFKNGESVQQALRSGAASFAKSVAHETLTQTSRVSEYVAGFGSGLASRPAQVPRNMLATTPHVVDSLSRGFQEAGHKIILVPYREYQRSGSSGAIKSVLKGIPVAIAAPMTGGAEALSYALLGFRNQLRPDVRKEEEISQRGLHLDH